jgi:hypothetical protein
VSQAGKHDVSPPLAVRLAEFLHPDGAIEALKAKFAQSGFRGGEKQCDAGLLSVFSSFGN